MVKLVTLLSLRGSKVLGVGYAQADTSTKSDG